MSGVRLPSVVDSEIGRLLYDNMQCAILALGRRWACSRCPALMADAARWAETLFFTFINKLLSFFYKIPATGSVGCHL